ncbi:maleylacetoacetate isomerase [Thiomonas sp. FB-Cd]|uniref:maleylacetoacetate isomerase n=1 Tax=Thiomonas sp. FB-Cd TaxID=1158292 RepID=UPI0004DF1480|nr:maleylacetoacetate isomerase [Thiomonas sp. FB-Cd]
MQLYSFFNSSTSYRVRIALELKGLAFEVLPVNLRGREQRSAAYMALNPSAGVPLLRDDDGFELTQSLAIIDYLDQTHPQPQLIPAEATIRARVLEFAHGIACDIHPINNLRVLRYLQEELGADETARNRWYAHWIAEGLRAAEAQLVRHGRGPYCFGDAPTLADICLVPQIANAERMKCDLEPYPTLRAVAAHCSMHKAFQAAAPVRQPDYVG